VRRCAVALLLALGAGSATFAQAAPPESPAAGQPISPGVAAGSTITISGEVQKVLRLSVQDLKKFKAAEVARRAEHPRPQAEGKPAEDRYLGCLLREVLNEAGLTQSHRRDLRRSYILVTATDGYQILFSWGEVFNTELGDAIYIAYERNGAPIDDAEGGIALFSLKDTAAGPRFARGVSTIQVLRAGDPPGVTSTRSK
jgi:hypothetical protein